jgi:uncharacterized phage-associated protein
MAYDARTIANEFLRIAKQQGRALTNMQLQKLVYIAHGYMLAIYDDSLINQRVEAWRYGPVIPDLYRALSEYGSGVVSQPIHMFPQRTVDDVKAKTLIDKVFAAYRGFSGPQLSTMTHREGTPWRQVFNADAFYTNDTIPNPIIKAHYTKLLHERAGINPR